MTTQKNMLNTLLLFSMMNGAIGYSESEYKTHQPKTLTEDEIERIKRDVIRRRNSKRRKS